jgi:hypothetical protein
MRLLSILLIVLDLFVAGRALAGDETIPVEPIGDWVQLVEPIDLPAARSSSIRDGIAVLLLDDQRILRDVGDDSFGRTVYRITDRTGLDDGGRLDVAYDPSDQRPILHWIRIIRDGVVIDQSRAVIPYIVGGEPDASKGIFQGNMTAFYNLVDVRVGDVVDYAFTFEYRPEVAGDLFHWAFATDHTTPTALIRKRILWPSGELLHVRNHGSDVERSMITEGGWTSFEWTIVDPEPSAVEEDIPPGMYGRPWVEVSSASTWQTIAETLADHYRLDDTLPDPLAADMDRIAALHADPGERLVEAMRYVQDRYRYVSLSLGAGSYVPRRAGEVVSSGYGDCKDKALLLASALKRLGIDAVVALTATSGGRVIPDRLPSLHAFDHAIVRARIGDAVYWIDATDYLKGGRADTMAQPSFGYALPLVAGADLERLPSPDGARPTATVREDFTMPTPSDGRMLLQVKSTYEKLSADQMRQKVSSSGLTGLGGDYLGYYRGAYPGLEQTAPLLVTDDRDANVIVIEESYALEKALLDEDGLIGDFPLRADLNPGLPKPAVGPRSMPVALGVLRYRRHIVKVSNLKARFGPPKDTNVLKPYFLLMVQSQSTFGTLEIDWHFRALMEEVPPEAFSKYLEAVDAVAENTRFRYNFAFEEKADASVR